jgi:hypothetical protein
VPTRAIMSAKSPVKGLGNLVKSKKSILDAKGNFKGEEDVEPTPELLAMANQSIDTAERAMANSDTEHAAVYVDGKQVLVKTSSEANFVDFTPKESKAMAGATFTHNHPPGPNGEPIPFSRGDVKMLLQNKIGSFRAVSGNTQFEMSPPKDSAFWKTSKAKLAKLLDSTFNAVKEGYGYTGNKPLPTEVLVRVLDDTLTLVDNTIGLGYKKTTL